MFRPLLTHLQDVDKYIEEDVIISDLTTCSTSKHVDLEVNKTEFSFVWTDNNFLLQTHSGMTHLEVNVFLL